MTSQCAARDDANYLIDTESYESIYMPKVARIPAHSEAGSSQESERAPFAGVSSQTDRHHDIEHHDEDELAHHEHGPGEALDPEVSEECTERLHKLEQANVQLPVEWQQLGRPWDRIALPAGGSVYAIDKAGHTVLTEAAMLSRLDFFNGHHTLLVDTPDHWRYVRVTS
jgi:hypothetical protein